MVFRWNKAELSMGSEAHYFDAALYDKTYARRKHDVAFYVECAKAQRPRARTILELGAGSGRVSLALVAAGFSVTAVDAMPSMIDNLRAKKNGLSSDQAELLHPKLGDLYTYRDRQKYDLVIFPFNVLMHCYARVDFERALTTARFHLAPNGRLVFDVLMPDMRAFFRDEERAYRAPDVVHPETKERYIYRERFAFDAAAQVQLVTSEYQSVKTGAVMALPLAHRQFFPAELQALMHYNGWRVEAHYGDFVRGAVELDCETQIIVARPLPEYERSTPKTRSPNSPKKSVGSKSAKTPRSPRMSKAKKNG